MHFRHGRVGESEYVVVRLCMRIFTGISVQGARTKANNQSAKPQVDLNMQPHAS